MKILFVSSEFFNKTGGGMVTRSYLNIVQDFTGKGHVIPFAFPRRNLKEEAGFEGVIAGKHYSNGEKVINTLCRKDPLIGAAVETELINCIRGSIGKVNSSSSRA